MFGSNPVIGQPARRNIPLGTDMKNIRSKLVAAAASLACASGAQAATVSIGFADGVLHNASAISETAVSSAAMAGMAVTMCFFDAACEVSTWGTGNPAAGAGNPATGQGWSFAAGADTFTNNFVLTVAGRQLQSFSLYGLGARTVFDTVTDPAVSPLRSSPGSGNGRPFTLENNPLNVASYNVSYYDKVFVDGTNYGDLYLGMRVSFNMAAGSGFNGFSGDLEFRADTDRVAIGGTLAPIAPTGPNPVPLPGTLLLVGAGLLGLGLTRRRC